MPPKSKKLAKKVVTFDTVPPEVFKGDVVERDTSTPSPPPPEVSQVTQELSSLNLQPQEQPQLVPAPPKKTRKRGEVKSLTSAESTPIATPNKPKKLKLFTSAQLHVDENVRDFGDTEMIEAECNSQIHVTDTKMKQRVQEMLNHISKFNNRQVEDIDHPAAEISKLQFSFMSAEEIVKWSVLEITSSKLSGPNSLFDLQLGPSNMNDKCGTCSGKWKTCPGHFGHINLPAKVPHPLRMKNIVEYLSLFCLKCYRLVITKEKMKLCGLDTKKGDVRFKALLKQRNDRVTTCPHCDEKLPTITFDDDFKFFGNYTNKTFPIAIKEIEDVFDNIPPCDISDLGFDSEFVHPSNLLMGAILVIPPCARSYVKNASGINHDDLTHKYQEIIKNVLKYHEAQNSKTKADYYDHICFHVRTLMDNSKGKAKNQGNKRGLKCLKKRMTSKSGLIRGHIQGKRVDFCARSVITPDATVWVDELVVPEYFAQKLAYPVKVNALNLRWCQELLNKDKVNNIYRDNKCFTASKVTWTRGFDLRENDVIIRALYNIDGEPTGEHQRISVFEFLKRTNGEYPEMQLGDVVQRHNKTYTDVQPKQRKEFLLREGDVIERQLMDGDWTLFNRQPTLWKGSMRAKKIKILPGKTFRFNLASTQAYNADFDGDEVS